MKTIIVDFLPACDEIMLKTDQVFFFLLFYFIFLNAFSSNWELAKHRRNMQLVIHSDSSWLPDWANKAVFISDKKKSIERGSKYLISLKLIFTYFYVFFPPA